MSPTNLNFKTEEPSSAAGSFTASPVQYARYKLSGAGSTNTVISLASGSASASTLHKCSDSAIDEVFLWCGNYQHVHLPDGHADAGDTYLYLGIGDTSRANTIVVPVSSKTGPIQVYPGIPHQDTTIYAWANSGSSLNIGGYVQRYYLNNPSTELYGYDGTE